MSTEVAANGKVHNTSDVVLEAVIEQKDVTEKQPNSSKESPEKKPRKKPNNKAIDCHLDIDAGAKRVKCRLNGAYKAFPSEAKDIKTDVPLRNNGCFRIGKKNYVVGKAIDRVNGEMIVASQDKKLSCVEIWILGAISHYRKFLKSCVDGRRRKTEPARLNLHLRMVTLSSFKRTELNKVLKAISAFSWEDTDFEVNVKSCEFIDEGEGAALEVAHTKDLEEFHVIDLGGGTCTHSTYLWDGDELSTEAKTPISGAGMTSVINKIFKALTRVDRGAIQAENFDIQEALELSSIGDDGAWVVPLRNNGEVQNIALEVEGALSEWTHGNYALLKQFDFISQRLARGESVFCTGGGFAVKMVADWIVRYLSKGIPNASIEVLENPQHINLSGLKWLDE